MSISLCEHDLPLRACEICREAADLLGKVDNVLISRAYLTEWVREANKYQDAINKLEALEKENAALRGGLAEARTDAERYRWCEKNWFRAHDLIDGCMQPFPKFTSDITQRVCSAIDAAIAKEGK